MKQRRESVEPIDVPLAELKAALARARPALAEDDYRKLDAALDTLSQLTELIAEKDTTIRDRRRRLMPASTEKTRDVLKPSRSRVAPAAQRENREHEETGPRAQGSQRLRRSAARPDLASHAEGW